MALQKITFDGSSVTAKRDADINHHLGGLVKAGIIEGLGNECSVSVSNNYITLKDGYVQIYGRRIYVEDGSQVYISLDSTKYGYVVVEVNLNTNSVALKAIEVTSSSYPSLTQQDLSKTGTLYQFPIAKYKKTTSSITLDTNFTQIFIKPGLRRANLVKKEIYAMFEDMNYETIKSVTIDISPVPYDAILFFTFSVVDTMGYGALGQIMGTVIIPVSELYWTNSYFPVRSAQNNGKSGTFMMHFDGSDFNKITITREDSLNGPNCVHMAYYVVE